MDEFRAKSASILRFLHDKEDDVDRNHDDDDHCKKKNVLFDDIVDMEVDDAVHVAHLEPMGSRGRGQVLRPRPKAKKKRIEGTLLSITREMSIGKTGWSSCPNMKTTGSILWEEEATVFCA